MNPGATRSSKKTASKSPLAAPQKRETENHAKTCNSDPEATVTPDELHRMIAVAAYCRSERRSFTGGDEVDDWLAAEAEIKKLLGNT